MPGVAGSDASGLVAIGADLEPSTIIAGYASGLFPMPVGRRTLGWWSPDPRAVIPLDGLVIARSLRRSLRRFEIRVDTNFEEVIRACASPARPHGWITPEITSAYRRLHDLGIAHSVETWADDHLVGGLYGISLGGLFAGESMFHLERDASKVALVRLIERLRERGGRLLDVQWMTPHLRSLGAVDVARVDYIAKLRDAVLGPSSF